MKKKLFLFILLICCLSANAQTTIAICTNVDGIWSQWKVFDYVYLYGNYGQLFMSDYGRHPSEFCWRLTINNNNFPSKSKEWLEYNGTIEYYISDEFQDAKSQFLDYRQQGFIVAPWKHNASKGDMPCVKVTKKAIIKIAPYKKHPKVYNVWFDDVGFGIDLGDTYFK